jgi:hypothetical protein
MHEQLTLVLAGVSAFTGALAGVSCVSFWLASKFNNIYKRIALHEMEDEKRFNALLLELVEVRMQAQVAAGLRPTTD